LGALDKAKIFIFYIGNLNIAETKLSSFYIGCIKIQKILKRFYMIEKNKKDV
jgi:hypothetical protein